MPLKRSLLQEDISLTTTAQYGAALTHVTLQAAITAIGSTRTVLSLLPGTWSIGANVTFPANIALYIRAGAIININTGVTFSVYEYRADLNDWQAGGGTFAHLRYPDMAGFVGWKQPAVTGAINRSLADHASEYLSGRDFGMSPTNTNNSAAFQAAITAAAATGKTLRIPAGIYPFASTLTINVPNIHVMGQGLVILQHTGTGAGMAVTGESTAPTGLYNVHLEGLTVQGNVNTSIAFLWRDLYRATATRLRARDCDYAFFVSGCRGCTWTGLTCSATEVAFAAKSAIAGLYVTSSVNTGYTAQCTFRDLRMEGLVRGASGHGIHVNQGFANVFSGGAVINCRFGIFIDTDVSNQNNLFEGFSSRNNLDRGAVCAGRMNRFVECHWVSATTIGIAAVTIAGAFNSFESCMSSNTASYVVNEGVGHTFRNCYMPYVSCQTGCRLPDFEDCAFDSDPSFGLQAFVPVRIRNCWRVDASLNWVSTYTDA